MATEKERWFDNCIDNILDRVSEIQAQAAKLEVGKKADPHKLYMDATEIEFCVDILREMQKD